MYTSKVEGQHCSGCRETQVVSTALREVTGVQTTQKRDDSVELCMCTAVALVVLQPDALQRALWTV